jgi:transposase
MGRGATLSQAKIWSIIHHKKQGLSTANVARRVGCTRPTVYKWWQRCAHSDEIVEAEKSGRKRAFDEAGEGRALELLTDGCGTSADQVSKRMCAESHTPVPVHKSTVIRAAQRAAVSTGKKLWVQRGRPPKAMTRATMEKRMAFAAANQNTNWAHVLFTDRKKFHFRYPGSKVQPSRWILGRASSSNTAVNQPNHAQCLNIYAGISKHGVTAVQVVACSSKHTTQHTNQQGKPARNITQSEYKVVMTGTLLPEGKRLFSTVGVGSWILQQDNDPAHKCASVVVQQWNADNAASVQLLPNWPPNSPDLNLIENVWSWVQREVDKKGCNSYEEFKQAVMDTLAAVPQQHLSNLWASMPNRLQAVVAAGGGPTKY